MKKYISLLIVLMMLLTVVGCSAKETVKTKEELKAEIKAEMEAEAKLKEELRAEVEAELRKDDQKDKIIKRNEESTNTEPTLEEVSEKMVTLSGTFIPYSMPFGTGIKLDTTFKYEGKEFEEIYINGESIEDYIPRKYFTYYSEGGTSVDESYIGSINLTVKIDMESLKVGSDLHELFTNEYKIISVDGDKPMDRTGDEYTLDYYKAVFSINCYREEGVLALNDVKETALYKSTDNSEIVKLYKKSVDNILASGLSITAKNGDYYIGDEQIVNHNRSYIKIDYTLPVKDFIEKYPPVDIVTEEDGAYYGYYTTLSYNDGLSVSIYHDDKDYNTGVIGNIEITGKYYSVDRISMGMSLMYTYEYCGEDYEKFYNRHQDVYEDELFTLSNGLTLAFNDRMFGEYPEVKEEDLVEKITIYLVVD